nr:hypothetical protein [Tanacetum cinerariifolium]
MFTSLIQSFFLNKEDEAKEKGNVNTSTTKYEDHEMTMESEEEFEEETKEEIKEKEEDSSKHCDTFPTMKELRYHEWILKNPRPSWVKAKVGTKKETINVTPPNEAWTETRVRGCDVIIYITQDTKNGL